MTVITFERRPLGREQKPANKKLNIDEEKLEAGQLIGEPKLSKRNVMKWRRKYKPLRN